MFFAFAFRATSVPRGTLWSSIIYHRPCRREFFAAYLSHLRAFLQTCQPCKTNFPASCSNILDSTVPPRLSIACRLNGRGIVASTARICSAALVGLLFNKTAPRLQIIVFMQIRLDIILHIVYNRAAGLKIVRAGILPRSSRRDSTAYIALLVLKVPRWTSAQSSSLHLFTVLNNLMPVLRRLFLLRAIITRSSRACMLLLRQAM